jgi:hypothetical protein
VQLLSELPQEIGRWSPSLCRHTRQGRYLNSSLTRRHIAGVATVTCAPSCPADTARPGDFEEALVALLSRMPAGFWRRPGACERSRWQASIRLDQHRSRRRRCSTNDANDANDARSQSCVAAGNGIAPRKRVTCQGHRHSCHFFCSICSSRNNRCSAVKLLPGIVACTAGFLFQLADVSRPDPRSLRRSADGRRAFPVILVRVVTSYFFESRRHIGGVATVTWGSRLAALARPIPLDPATSRKHWSHCSARMPVDFRRRPSDGLVGRACALEQARSLGQALRHAWQPTKPVARFQSALIHTARHHAGDGDQRMRRMTHASARSTTSVNPTRPLRLGES